MKSGVFGGVMVAILGLPGMAVAELIEVPSGQGVSFYDVIWERDSGGDTYRFRYFSPSISRDGGLIDFEKAEPDMKALCENSALPALVKQERAADRIIITLMDRPVEFGKPDPTATQFIDAFRPENGTCIWEGF
jgi:hypothetical protein